MKNPTHDQIHNALYMFLECLQAKIEIEEGTLSCDAIWTTLKSVLDKLGKDTKNPAYKKLHEMMVDQDRFYAKPEIAETVKNESKAHFIGTDLYKALGGEPERYPLGGAK